MLPLNFRTSITKNVPKKQPKYLKMNGLTWRLICKESQILRQRLNLNYQISTWIQEFSDKIIWINYNPFNLKHLRYVIILEKELQNMLIVHYYSDVEENLRTKTEKQS